MNMSIEGKPVSPSHFILVCPSFRRHIVFSITQPKAMLDFLTNTYGGMGERSKMIARAILDGRLDMWDRNNSITIQFEFLQESRKVA